MINRKNEGLVKKYEKVASILNKAGEFSLPFSDTLLEILRYTIGDENLDFLNAFENNISQTMEQLKSSSGLSEDEILKKVNTLAKTGVIFDQPNRTGLMIYRLLPIMRQSEYIFMQELEPTEEIKWLASLFQQLHQDLIEIYKQDENKTRVIIANSPPIDRTVPFLQDQDGEQIELVINEKINVPEEKQLPTQDIVELFKKYDEIAVGRCYCRQQQEMLGKPCKQIDLSVESCFTLGKSARHTSKHGFSRMISQREALDLLKKIKAAGLVHKAYHLYSDPDREEVAVCNCCLCCCANNKKHLFIPIKNASYWMASVHQELCVGCGICVDKCHNYAIELSEENKAVILEDDCIGCGVCAYNCPEKAISLKNIKRLVNIFPDNLVK
ncbi:MAG: 4Fe-4S binding protein [Candidatus Lokiarchaeota archaeon]|nr:4Fe-4S binding protein [Candidatus Lokiarchaeota archaeon]